MAKKRSMGELQLLRVVSGQTGDKKTYLELVSTEEEFSQTRDLERWVANAGTKDLPDGEYVLARVVKGVKVSSVTTREIQDFELTDDTNDTDDPEPTQDESASETSTPVDPGPPEILPACE